MTESQAHANSNPNIWAPWRMEYIDSLDEGDDDGCFLCYARDGDSDSDNLVLWRSRRTLTVLNRFPYTGGHCLIAPLEHLADLSDLGEADLLEIMQIVRDTQRILTSAVKAQGFNIGMNIGRCAGAGLPGHLHVHVVPRWSGDVNMMTAIGGVRVVPISLKQLYETITAAAAELGLPRATD